MGDRGRVQIIESKENSFYLYTHWGGDKLLSDVKTILSKGARLNDSAYLSRLILVEMMGDQSKEETGFGISVFKPETEYWNIALDCDKGTITFSDGDYRKMDPVTMPFKVFLDIPEVDLKAFWEEGFDDTIQKLS